MFSHIREVNIIKRSTYDFSFLSILKKNVLNEIFEVLTIVEWLATVDLGMESGENRILFLKKVKRWTFWNLISNLVHFIRVWWNLVNRSYTSTDQIYGIIWKRCWWFCPWSLYWDQKSENNSCWPVVCLVPMDYF